MGQIGQWDGQIGVCIILNLQKWVYIYRMSALMFQPTFVPLSFNIIAFVNVKHAYSDLYLLNWEK